MSFLDRSERHKGPGGPHPRAKIPEGKVESDFVSLGADLATNSISSRHLGSSRAGHMEFLAKRAAQNKHLIWFSSITEVCVCAPRSGYCSTPGRVSVCRPPAFCWRPAYCMCCIRRALRGYPRRPHRGVSAGTGNGTPALVLRSGALLHEHPSLLAGAGAVLITFGILVASGGFSALRRRITARGCSGVSRPVLSSQATHWSMVTRSRHC